MKLELILSDEQFKDLINAVTDGIERQTQSMNLCKSNKYKEIHKNQILKYMHLRNTLHLARSCYQKGD